MSPGPTFWIGADPGGRGNFGIAILAGNDNPQTESVNCADEELDTVPRERRATKPT